MNFTLPLSYKLCSTFLIISTKRKPRSKDLNEPLYPEFKVEPRNLTFHVLVPHISTCMSQSDPHCFTAQVEIDFAL